MKAMILAAGLGTRLRPLTESRPKALVEIHEISLLELMIKKLHFYGFDNVIVNVHHFADQLVDFLNKKPFGIHIRVSDEREKLLDTGGAVQKARWFLKGSPFLLVNVDVLSDLNFRQFFEYHKQSNVLATLAVRKRDSGRYLLFDEENLLTGWKNVWKQSQILCRNDSEVLNELAFSGLHVINPEIFDLIEENGSFSIIDVYLRLAKAHKINCYRHDEGFWTDAGSIETINKIRVQCSNDKELLQLMGLK